MHSHPNARLTQKGRFRLVTQHLVYGRSLAELAAENGISLRCPVSIRLMGGVNLVDRWNQAPFSTVARTLSRLGFGR